MKTIIALATLALALGISGCGDKEAGSDVKVYPQEGPAGGSSSGMRPGTPGAPPAANTAGSGSSQAGSRPGTGSSR